MTNTILSVTIFFKKCYTDLVSASLTQKGDDLRLHDDGLIVFLLILVTAQFWLVTDTLK